MISVAFINDGYEPLLASDPFLPLEKLMEENTEDIDFAVSSYLNIHGQYMIESEIMGELDEEKSVYLEAERENVFDKIGKAIIAVCKKFADIVSKIITWVKDLGLKNKSDQDKVERVLKEYKKEDPKQYQNIANELYKAIDTGRMGLADARTLKEIKDITDSTLKAAKQQSVDPKSLRGKLQELEAKFDEIDKGKLNKAATVTKGVVGAVVSIATIRGVILKSKKDIMDYENLRSTSNEEIIKTVEDLKTRDGGKYSPDTMTKAQILHNVAVLLNKKIGTLITKEEGKLKSIDTGITSWLKRYEKKKTDEFLANTADAGKRISDRDAQKREEERRKNRQDAADKSYGQKKGEHDYYGKHKHQVDSKIASDVKVKTKASDSLVNGPDTDEDAKNHRQAITKQSELQERGKARVTPKQQPKKNNP